MIIRYIAANICLLLVLFNVGSCWGFGKSSDDIPQDLDSDVNKRSISPVNYRSLDDFSVSDYLLISDIEGNLHNVDRSSGSLIWTIPFNEPLIKLEANTSNKADDSNILWFVEPYMDGSLYYFTPEFGLNKLPATIKDLVLESPFSLTGDDKIYTGTRKTSLYTINIRTGEVIDQFGDTCPKRSFTGPLEDVDYIMIGRTTYELTIHSRTNNDVVWYVTYSQWGPNNIDLDLMTQNQKSVDEVYFTPFHDKSLLAINKELGAPMWISKLPSLAVNVFDIFSNEQSPEKHIVLPHPLKVLNDLQLNQDSDSDTINNNLCFVNKTVESDQWFAMSFINYPTLIKSAPISPYQMTLFRLESQIADYDHLDHLRHLNLNSSGSDQYINGVHRFSHLDSETSYQPVSKFKDMKSKYEIEDGSTSTDAVGSTDSFGLIIRETSTNLQIPDIIEGIKFTRASSRGRDVASKDDHYSSMEADGKERKDIIRSYYDDYYSSEYWRRDVSVSRRIFEIFMAVIILVLYLVPLSKAREAFSAFNKWRKTFDFHMVLTIDIEPSDKKKKKAKKLGPSILEQAKAAVFALDVKSSSYQEFDQPVELDSQTPVDTDPQNNEISPELSETLISENSAKSPDQHANSSAGVSDKNIGEPVKKRRKRGGRGGKRARKKHDNENDQDHGLEDDNEKSDHELDQDSDSEDSGSSKAVITKSLLKSGKIHGNKSLQKLQIENDLVLSNKILGYGSHGTVVFEGTFESRPVAVKRMLLDFYDVANHEVSLLQQSDDHPNVVRYFCSQTSDSEKFLYIALELCQGSLEDLIEFPKAPRLHLPKLPALKNCDYSDLLFQLTSGLHYLHKLKIVHRDMKPQNILIGEFKNRKSLNGDSNIRLLISDFGLCKKLDHDQSSFRATSSHFASGTAGWRAPELLLNHDISEISPDTVASISSDSTSAATSSSVEGRRLTKAIDIFPLGCIFYYILTGGSHPFGDRYMREGNIINGKYDLSLLSKLSDKYESTHLIESMICHNPALRPDTDEILKHPYFWSVNKKLQFLLKVSDRFEVERRDPPSPLLLELEKCSASVTNGNWHKKFDAKFMDNLGKYRKYQPERLMDLLRAIRNKYHHFNDMPADLQQQMSPLPSGFYKYFSSKFPNLLMETYFVVDKHLKQEHIFEEFY